MSIGNKIRCRDQEGMGGGGRFWDWIKRIWPLVCLISKYCC